MMRNVTDYSLEEIQSGLKKARECHAEMNDQMRILFAPLNITDHNFKGACNMYSRLDLSGFDTAVIVEAHTETLDKKLPMPSNREFRTPLGPVPADDYLRNEFCDEEDDFFIHDEAFSKNMSLFQQLMMLQAGMDMDSYDNFSALSVQIADESSFIVKELAHVLEEVLASRNALLIFCCDLEDDYQQEFEEVKKMVNTKAHSRLLNYLNSGQSHITGAAAFVTGILVAAKWDMRVNFGSGQDSSSLLTAYSDREGVMY
jgi:AmmeMemoRadiSam system protein B